MEIVKVLAKQSLRYLVLAIVCCSALFLTNSARALDLLEPEAKPSLLLDAESGNVLFSENAFRKWAPASLTKLMTAYVVFRSMKLQHVAPNSPVRVSEYALQQPPTKMGFPIGTILTVDNALKIIMVKSANDISVALGEAVSGSEEAFVALMNAHARRLGMHDTNFRNPHGLHDPLQYTTARDMGILALALTREFPEYSSYFDIPAIRHGKRRLRNHNALLERFDGTDGMKTGYICASGYNVVVRAQRDSRRLISVILGARSGLERSVRAARLLTEGFDGLYERNAILLEKFSPAGEVLDVPEDITRLTCPRKYVASAIPTRRPAENPKPVAGIKVTGKLVSSAAAATVDLAETRPQEEELPVEKPPSLGELEALYLTPRKRVGEDQVIVLGGGIGPNPNNLKHTNGGPAKPVTPIPQKKP